VQVVIMNRVAMNIQEAKAREQKTRKILFLFRSVTRLTTLNALVLLTNGSMTRSQTRSLGYKKTVF